jgi:hypothetical protein
VPVEGATAAETERQRHGQVRVDPVADVDDPGSALPGHLRTCRPVEPDGTRAPVLLDNVDVVLFTPVQHKLAERRIAERKPCFAQIVALKLSLESAKGAAASMSRYAIRSATNNGATANGLGFEPHPRHHPIAKQFACRRVAALPLATVLHGGQAIRDPREILLDRGDPVVKSCEESPHFVE